MKKVGKATKLEARKAVQAFGLGETHGLEAYTLMEQIIKHAKYHHSIQEHHCNGTVTPALETKEKTYEKRISEYAEKLGIKAVFDGDPRGYTVKLHAKDGKGPYNTFGGQEAGYGVGEK